MTVVAAAAVLLAVLFVLLGQLNSFHALRQLSEANTAQLRRSIDMSTQAVVDQIVAQLAKAKDEIVAKLQDATSGVQAQLVDAGVADQVDLSALAAIAQQLDDIVPDEVVVDPEVEDAVEGDEVELVDDSDEGALVDLTDEDAEVVDEAVDEVVDESDDAADSDDDQSA